MLGCVNHPDFACIICRVPFATIPNCDDCIPPRGQFKFLLKQDRRNHTCFTAFYSSLSFWNYCADVHSFERSNCHVVSCKNGRTSSGIDSVLSRGKHTYFGAKVPAANQRNLYSLVEKMMSSDNCNCITLQIYSTDITGHTQLRKDYQFRSNCRKRGRKVNVILFLRSTKNFHS